MYAPPFVATFFLVMFFLEMQFFWLYVDDLIGKGLSLWIIFKLLYFISFSLVSMALPLAILLSSIMTFGNLAENYELAAMKSAGISLYRIMRPLIVLMIVMAISVFYFANYAVPYANFKSKNLLYNITKQKPALNLKEGIFNTSIPGYSIRLSEKWGKDEENLKDLIIYDHNSSNKNSKSITAKNGIMEIEGGGQYLKLTLFDGYLYEETQDDKNLTASARRLPFTKTKFDQNIVYFDLSSFNMDNITDEKFSSNYAMMNNEQLEVAIDSLKELYAKRELEQAKGVIARMRYNLPAVDSLAFNIDSLAYLNHKDSIRNILAENDSLPRNLILDHFDSGRVREEVISSSIEQSRKVLEYISVEVVRNKQTLLEHIAKHVMEIHKKYSFSFICIVMFFVGAPLGAIIRKGGLGMPVVVAVVIFIFYHVNFMIAEKLGRAGEITAFWARWLPALILTPFGILLTRKATTDSAIFNAEIYFAPIYRFLGLVKRKKEEYKKTQDRKKKPTGELSD